MIKLNKLEFYDQIKRPKSSLGAFYRKLSLCQSLAIDTAILRFIFIGEDENVGKLLLGGGDATRIVATYYVRKLLGKGHCLLFDKLTVTNYVDSDTGTKISEHVGIDIDVFGNLDDILFTHFSAWRVLDYCNMAIKLVKSEVSVDLHALSCGDVVDNYSVFDRIYIHNYLTVRGA